MTTIRPIQVRPRPEPNTIQALQSLDPLHARLFATRGVTDVGQLDYGLSRLAPVGSLENVDAAVDLLLRKRETRITIVGDFDVDGATSTALLMRCLQKFGFRDPTYLVPNRFEYGYGLTPEIVQVAARDKPDLIVTVDNGISSIAGVQAATEAGIPVLITDHHLPGRELPQAEVIVNPNLSGSEFPSRNLAGVGVAFYVMAALGKRLESEGQSAASRIPAEYLDLVALGTIADVVPLDHNNRVLVEQGILRMRAGKTVAGIRALLAEAGRPLSRTVSTDLGFAVGPRLNAAGRLEDMSIGIECLLSDDPDGAADHAAVLSEINKQRKEIETTMRDQAFAFVDSMNASQVPPCVCLYDETWHQGVVGLIASRVKERCHRPAIAFARESDGFLKGSARSVTGIHIRDLLERVASAQPGLIDKYGGHAMAAGLTIAESAYAAFVENVSAELTRFYPEADFSGAIVSDGHLPGDAHSLEFAQSLRAAGPWGSAFPEPLWHGDFDILEQRTVGQKHLKLRVQPAAGGRAIDAIAFNQAGPAHRGVVQLAYRLDVNSFRGVERPQLIVEQVAPLYSARDER